MSDEWLGALAPSARTGASRSWSGAGIIILFAEHYAVGAGGEKVKNYYVQERCRIAAGLFTSARSTSRSKSSHRAASGRHLSREIGPGHQFDRPRLPRALRGIGAEEHEPPAGAE